MYVCITGFSPDENEDDSLKYEICLDPRHSEKIAQILGHKNLNAMAVGDWILTSAQAEQISQLIGNTFPTGLRLFISLER